MVIAVAHDPPAVTLHSIQDGRQLGHLPIHAPTQLPGKLQLTGITWFQAEKKDTNASMPDIFMRGHDIVRAFSFCMIISWDLFSSRRDLRIRS